MEGFGPWSQSDPLMRAPGESKRANQALHDYAMMGSARSLRALDERYNEQGANGGQTTPTKKRSTLNGWSAKFAWQLRVQRWEELEREREMDQWRERRRVIAEEDWQQSRRLHELCERIHDAAPAFINRSTRVATPGTPTVVRPDGSVVSQGTPEQVIVTIALDAAVLARLEKLRSELGRVASGADVQQEGPDVVVQFVGMDVQSMFGPDRIGVQDSG